MTPVSPQSYGTKLPVGTAIRRYVANLRIWSFECMFPGPFIGGKQNWMRLAGTLALNASFCDSLA